jgi:hypothetical protein
MAFTQAEIKGKILRLLQKTAKHPGAYSDDRVSDAIEEAMDFVSTEMFLADEGWLRSIEYFDTTAGQVSIDLPPGISMVAQVRYQFANTLITMQYNQSWNQDQYVTDSGVRQWAYQYRIVENALYFNPPLAEGGEGFLQVEFQRYPKRLQDDTDFLESQFDYCMMHFIKYRAASILAAGVEKFQTSWAALEQSWYAKMLAIVTQRNQASQPITDFCGY